MQKRMWYQIEMGVMVDVIRVLYVDDKPALLELGKIYLQKSGDFSVITADSAEGALDLLNSSPFDAIISDYQMPMMDGIHFLTEVRKNHGQIPFILFTEKGREEVVVDAINSGVDFYVQKGGDLVAQYADLAHKVRLAVERHTVNKALEESEERFRGIAERISDLIIIADQKGPTYVSPSVQSILGFPPGYYVGKSANPEIFPREDLGKLVQAMERLAMGSPLEEVEFRMKKKDGTYAVFEGKGTPVLSGGSFSSVQVIARDITDRKQAEQSLRLQHDLSLELNKCNTLDDACNHILSAILKIEGPDSGGFISQIQSKAGSTST